MKPISARQVNTIKRMRKERHTINQIINTTGLSEPTVRKYIDRSEIYDVCKAYYEDNKEDLKLRHGIRSAKAFINYCLREQLKKIGAI